MIQIPLTPDKYQAALKHLMDLRPPQIDFLQLPTGTTPGQLTNSQITAQFTYDGANVNLTILEKHGFFVQRASDNTIKSHILDYLTGV